MSDSAEQSQIRFERGVPPSRVMEGWVSLRDVLIDGQRRLAQAGVASPEVDATLLAAHVLGVPRGRLYLHDRLPPEQRMAYERLLSRRIARVPLQHLLGEAGFRRVTLAVGPGVFVPRPETELVAQVAIDALVAMPVGQRRAVDLCAGSGAIAFSLAVEVPGCSVSAVEVDPAAIVWTRANLERMASRIAVAGSDADVIEADATTCADPGGALADGAGRVDVVTVNPPYVPDGARVRDPEVRDHDPPRALYGGPDGLDVVRGVLRTAATLLRPGGLLVVEHSDEQGEAAGPLGVPGLLHADHRWVEIADHLDLARRPRYTTATRKA